MFYGTILFTLWNESEHDLVFNKAGIIVSQRDWMRIAYCDVSINR